MLLYTHPFNAAREAQGLPAVNAFWVHGAGALPADWQTPRADPATTPSATVTVAEDLRAPALREDWPAWTAAWQRLDAGPLAALHAQLQRGAAVQLTLSGENGALHFGPAQRNLLQRLQSVFRPLRLSDLHNAL